MSKVSALDKAIAAVEAEIDLLQQILARLTAQKKQHQPKPRGTKKKHEEPTS